LWRLFVSALALVLGAGFAAGLGPSILVIAPLLGLAVLLSFVHRLLLTPQGHRIHHAGDLELAMHNYANVFAFWDVLFGTFRHPDERPHPVLGDVDESMPATFAGQLLAPFARGRRALRA
jgi:sterol desaturase/sphingolipid hydroxylase (fatty acid hydroxylase superfamily)